MENQIRVHLLISGRVQGVMFRVHAQREAIKLDVAGWAHNLLDGKVEIMCEGDEKPVGTFIEWCKQGSPLAKVAHVDVSFEEYRGEFKDFEVREFGF